MRVTIEPGPEDEGLPLSEQMTKARKAFHAATQPMHGPAAPGGEVQAIGDLAVLLDRVYAERTQRLLTDVSALLLKDARGRR